MDVSFRFGGEEKKFAVDGNLGIDDVIHVIAGKLNRPNEINKELVVSPSPFSSGLIVPRSSVFKNVMFNSKKDVLELWKAPKFVHVILLIEQEGVASFRDKKKMLIDFGTPLTYMLPSIMRVLQIESNQACIIKHSATLGEDVNIRKTWLHTNISLEEHGVEAEEFIYCLPVGLHLATPEKKLGESIIRGWLHKRSFKNETHSAKQKRLFVFANHLLYYYRKENDSCAAGAIPLEYYNVTERSQPKKRKFALILSLNVTCFTELNTLYKLQAENEQIMHTWFRMLECASCNFGSHRMFGVDICVVVARKENESKSVPNIVRDCVRFLRNNALDQEGIFRLSAAQKDIELYKEKYNTGTNVGFPSTVDNNIPAALLKLYLRELPEPLFPFRLFPRLVALDTKSDDLLEFFGSIISELVIPHYGTLKIVINFLGEIIDHTNTNKMTASSLATVVGPNIIRTQKDVESVQHFNVINRLAEILISHREELFSIAEGKNENLKLCAAAPRLISNRSTYSVNMLTNRGKVDFSRGVQRGGPPPRNRGIQRPISVAIPRSKPGSSPVLDPKAAFAGPSRGRVRKSMNIRARGGNRQSVGGGNRETAGNLKIPPSKPLPPAATPTVKQEEQKIVTAEELLKMIEVERSLRLVLSKTVDQLEQRIARLEAKQ